MLPCLRPSVSHFLKHVRKLFKCPVPLLLGVLRHAVSLYVIYTEANFCKARLLKLFRCCTIKKFSSRKKKKQFRFILLYRKKTDSSRNALMRIAILSSCNFMYSCETSVCVVTMWCKGVCVHLCLCVCVREIKRLRRLGLRRSSSPLCCVP